MHERPKMVSHTCLLMIEIQLQQLALEGKCFHVAVIMEDVKALESLFAQSADQWSHHVESVTSRGVWVAQAGSGVQRLLAGSKHACPSGLRLWRAGWRTRPTASFVLLEYLVAAHPEPQRARRAAARLASSESEEQGRVVRECSAVLGPGDNAVLQVKATDSLLVVHTQLAVKLYGLASRQLLRDIVVSARRIRVHGFHLWAICTDEPPRVLGYDLVNENAPALVLACPEVVPTEVAVATLRGAAYVLACGSDRAVHVWIVPKRAAQPLAPLFSLVGHRDYVTCLAADERSGLIFTGSCDCTVGVWDSDAAAGAPAPKAMLSGHTDWVFGLALARNNKVLLSCSRDATVRVWDVEQLACVHVVSTSGSRALSLTLGPSGGSEAVAVALGNNRVALLDLLRLGGEARPAVLSGHAGRVTAVLFWRGLLVTASLDHSVRVWEPASGVCVAVLRGHQDAVNALVLQGDQLFSGSDDGAVLCWRLAELGLPDAGAVADTPRGKAAGLNKLFKK